MLAFFLIACADEKPPESGGGPEHTAEDTGAEDEPAETWEAPDVACALVSPLPVSVGALPSFWDLYGPDHIDLASLWYSVGSYAEQWGCPEGSADTAAGTEAWDGACALDELTWEGRFTATSLEGADGSYVDRFDGEGVRFVETYWDGYAIALDGHSSYEGVAGGRVMLGERVFDMSLAGYREGADGEWSVRSTEAWTPEVSYTFQLQVTASTALLDGDYCLLQESYRHPACDEEPWGGWVLQGDATVVVTFDPEVACDGCGEMTLDGVPAGQVCGDEYGTWVP